MTDATPDTSPGACTGTNQDGGPCRAPPLADGERCVHHANLPRTTAQQEASRRNGRKHGYFPTLLSDEDQAEFPHAWEALQRAAPDVLKQLAAYAVIRAGRVAKWESDRGTPSPLTMLALERAQKAVQAFQRSEETPGFSREDLARIVDTMAKDPEIFLARMPPELAAEVRALLGRAGVGRGTA